MGRDVGWDPPPIIHDFIRGTTNSPPPLVFLLGLKVGSNGGAGGSLLRLVLLAKSAALAYKQLQRNKETNVSPTR